MKRPFRFTFVADRYNRTAAAVLIGALESLVDEAHRFIRAVSPEKLPDLVFDRSGACIEIVCMSAMTANFARVCDMLDRLRTRWGRRGFVSICGGAHPSGDPQGTLDAGFDYCCVGEGEEVIRDVARCVATGIPIDSIPGIVSSRRGRLCGGGRMQAVDIERYPPLPVRIRVPTYIEIGRGCRWRCAYCQTPHIHGSLERFRSAEAIEATVAVYARLGMKDFRFLLPNALGYASTESRKPNCAALDELLGRARAAAKGGRLFLGSFPSEVRPDYLTDDAVSVLKAHVSNRKLVIGGQSGSQRILDVIGRGHTVQDIRQACRIATGHGLISMVDMVLGFPGETEEDRHDSFRLIGNLARDGAAVNMHFFMPLPGTALADSAPVFLTDTDRRELDQLAQRGIVRGRWRRQEELARQWLGPA